MPNILTPVTKKWEPSMGEVRVKVKLSNAADEALVRHGQMNAGDVRRYKADALIDTRYVRCILPESVAEALAVRCVLRTVSEPAGGKRFNRTVSDEIRFDLMGRKTMEEALISGDRVVIGSAVLAKLDLWIDCQNRRLVGNPAHPDQPVTKVK